MNEELWLCANSKCDVVVFKDSIYCPGCPIRGIKLNTQHLMSLSFKLGD